MHLSSLHVLPLSVVLARNNDRLQYVSIYCLKSSALTSGSGTTSTITTTTTTTYVPGTEKENDLVLCDVKNFKGGEPQWR